jgi:hypothetical protein
MRGAQVFRLVTEKAIREQSSDRRPADQVGSVRLGSALLILMVDLKYVKSPSQNARQWHHDHLKCADLLPGLSKARKAWIMPRKNLL